MNATAASAKTVKATGSFAPAVPSGPPPVVPNAAEPGGRFAPGQKLTFRFVVKALGVNLMPIREPGNIAPPSV